MAIIYQGNLSGTQEIDLGAYYLIDYVVVVATTVGGKVNQLTATDPHAVYNFGYIGFGSSLAYGSPAIGGYHMCPRMYVDWLNVGFTCDFFDPMNRLIAVFNPGCAADVQVHGH